MQDIALRVEHVGSTAVPGLAAKPVIDMSIVLASAKDIPTAIKRLAPFGYDHLGNLGIEGRHAFSRPKSLPAHNLYVCPQNSPGLENHLRVRDYLRAHPETARAYGELKKRLARKFPHDIDRYVEGKTDLILAILRKEGVTLERLASIEQANRAG